MNSHRNIVAVFFAPVSRAETMPAGRRELEHNGRLRESLPRSRPLHRWVVGSQVLLLLFLCSCATGRKLLPTDMTAQKVVQRYAEAAFEVVFDDTASKDRGALKQYKAKIESARNRVELEGAWVAIPELKAHGADFLQKQIFDRAARDGDWPSGGPAANEKVVYVDAVRAAIDVFLNEGTEDNP